MRRRFRSLVAPTLLALVIATPSFAQKRKTVREELSGDALRAWDDAMALLQQQVPDYDQASVKFEEAYSRSHNPRVLFNLGVSEKNRQRPNHYSRALARFRQEQAEGLGRISPAEVQELKDAIAALERQVSTLQITVNEADANVAIDGDSFGTTPLAPVTVDVGPRVVLVTKKGFVDQSQTVRVNTGVPEKVTFTLDPTNKTGRVSVAVEGAPGAMLRLDGKDVGPAPFKGEVPAGPHDLEAVAPGFVTAKKHIDVAYKGEPIDITLSMSAERHQGKLRIDTQPVGATIEIDGTVVATTSWEGPLDSTVPHQVVAKLKGYDTWQQDISVPTDASLIRVATLNESKSTGWIAWTFGTIGVVAGGAVVGYFVFRKSDPDSISGSLRSDVGIPVSTSYRVRLGR